MPAKSIRLPRVPVLRRCCAGGSSRRAQRDNETGTTWNLLGQGLTGPLAGEQLEAVPHGNHFWFAWGVFKPDTVVYTGAPGN